MLRSAAWFFLIAAMLQSAAPTALAGMPSPVPVLTEAGKLGLQRISFFAAGLLLSAAFLKWIWNSLAGDFPRLPRLSFLKACGVVVLWGLLFVIVLTMISGARELMTPGAWKSNGLTYELAERADATVQAGTAESAGADESQAERRKSLTALHERLREYAAEHEGRFPDSIEDSGFVAQRWMLPGPTSMQYKYVPGASASDARSVLVAYEPNVFGDEPLALFADGRIVAMPIDVIVGMLPAEGGE